MDNRFVKLTPKFRCFGEKIKVISGLSYDIRRTLTESVLSYQDLLRTSVDDLAPDDYEFEFGRYSTENNIDLLNARENTSRLIREQSQQSQNSEIVSTSDSTSNTPSNSPS